MQCSLCQQTLQTMECGKATVFACGGETGCGAAVVLARELVPLMEYLAGTSMADIDLDEDIQPVELDARPMSCPHCRRAMESFGYLGSPLVHLHRCSAAHPVTERNAYTGQPQTVDRGPVIFGSAEELGVAAMLFARSQRRIGERGRKDKAMRDSWASSTRARNGGRAAAHIIGATAVVGGLPAAAVAAAALNARKTNK
ncbi:MAG: hypothetical protein AB8H79_24870 [Myxococcota bacterium]